MGCVIVSGLNGNREELMEEVERSKSTAFLNLIIRLYSLGEYPV